MPSTLVSLGLRVRDLRQCHGLTQEQLAVLIGRNRTTITNIELGKQNPTFLLLVSLADALGCQLTMFFDPKQ